MPTVKNLNYGPVTIERENDVPLTIGPREAARLSAAEFGSPDVQRHVREGRFEVLDADEPQEKKAQPQPPAKPQPHHNKPNTHQE